MGIVQNEAFWATSLAFMNDSQEYNHGLSVFKDCFDEVNSSKFVHPIQKKFLLDCLEIAENQAHRIKIFVLCASLERDSLAQWRGYTAFSAGYAIGLDPKDTPIIVSPHQDVGSSGLDSHQGWAQVLYAPEDQVTFAKDTINFILASTPHPLNKGLPPWKDCVSIFATYMVTNSCYMKHSSFHEEREVRCVFSAISDIDNEAVSYRVTNYGIAPYLSIGLDHQDNSAELIVRSQVAPPLRIQEVLVGPSSHVDTLVIGVEQFLKSFKQDAIVTRSETSFR
ncbi:MAG: hypothetical protein DI630_35025 [Gordonia sp. (in: high G+C Gram-positive bacteria)]|nr:MAG: hypothetical protein DI630_35025 [Gordonia sp. (in: high G+C Gram-positive bacteria)]